MYIHDLSPVAGLKILRNAEQVAAYRGKTAAEIKG